VDTDDHLPAIDVDSGAVSEAMLNIIDNAVKYSRERKYVRVSTGLEGTAVFIDIEDHGIGIDPRQQKRIFEKFYRVSSGLTHETRGTGLGLALVKHIMDAHRGNITLRSEAGKGSTFRLTFPIHLMERT
jgi:two-component system phosphate regulon sensor histidine kinase PhoR